MTDVGRPRRRSDRLPAAILVPYWAVSLILLALLFLVIVGALLLVPSAQRPTLSPPNIPASSAAAPAPSARPT